MCKLLSMKKLQTMPYHPWMNGLVERSHQTIVWMIGKLGEDKKANWPGHLAEIVHAYHATQSAMMGYSPHYLMFGCRPRLLVDFYFPTLRSGRGPKDWHLFQVCGWICSHCMRPIEGHPSRGPGPVYGRGSKTKMVLWPENRCHRIEAWWTHPSQGRCLSREEEDQGQMGGQASWGGVSDCNRHPLIWSERPTWTFTHPTSQLAPPCSVRSWHSLMCGCLPSMGQMYQPHPHQAYSQRDWQQDYTIGRWWSGDHPMSG